MSIETEKDLKEKISRLKKELEERKSSLPAHSLRPHQLLEIEELEEEISELEERLNQLKKASP